MDPPSAPGAPSFWNGQLIRRAPLDNPWDIMIGISVHGISSTFAWPQGRISFSRSDSSHHLRAAPLNGPASWFVAYSTPHLFYSIVCNPLIDIDSTGDPVDQLSNLSSALAVHGLSKCVQGSLFAKPDNRWLHVSLDQYPPIRPQNCCIYSLPLVETSVAEPVIGAKVLV